MPATTHVLGPTLMPGWLMPRYYRRLAARLSGGGPVGFHPMPERGGLGRTDRIVDSFRPLLEDAAAAGTPVRLAGHSLGGIVAWVLAQEYPRTVEVAELWCAPIRGTALASVTAPVAESRFLAPASRWLRRYDRPVYGPLVRAVYTPLDQLAVPAATACYVEGNRVENHVVAPFRIPRRRLRWLEFAHRGAAEHVTLPRLANVHDRLAARDRC
jgi:pimeloyl-ACP methyl ester carboxylesterase